MHLDVHRHRRAPYSPLFALASLALLSACAPQASTPQVSATIVETRPVQLSSSYTTERIFIGQIEPGRSGAVGFEIAGTLVELDVDVGDAVPAGAVLARLDRARLEAREREARAVVDEAASMLVLARTTHTRTRELHRLKAVSNQEMEEAENALRAAEARLHRAEASAAVIAVDLDSATLRAPYGAVVDERLADLGSSLSPGQPILRLTERDRHEVRFSLPSASAEHLTPGQRFSFTSEGVARAGTLSRIRLARDAATRAVEAFLTVDTADVAHLRPASVVAVRLPIEVFVSGLWLPRAVLTEGTRGLWACYVPEPLGLPEPTQGATHRLVRVDLEWLHAEGERVFVRGPLQDGDAVVMTGLQRLVPGLGVRLANSQP